MGILRKYADGGLIGAPDDNLDSTDLSTLADNSGYSPDYYADDSTRPQDDQNSNDGYNKNFMTEMKYDKQDGKGYNEREKADLLKQATERLVNSYAQPSLPGVNLADQRMYAAMTGPYNYYSKAKQGQIQGMLEQKQLERQDAENNLAAQAKAQYANIFDPQQHQDGLGRQDYMDLLRTAMVSGDKGTANLALSALGPKSAPPTTKDSEGNPLVWDASQGKFVPITGEGGAPVSSGLINDQNRDLTGDEFLKTLDPNDASQVKALLEGRKRVPPSFSLKRNPKMANLVNAAYQADPDFNENRFNAASKFDTGPQGNQIRSFNVGISHLDTLSKLADALENKDTKFINSISNEFRNQFGSDVPTDFDAAKGIVGDEITKAIIGGAGAVTDREDLKKKFSSASSPAQLKGVVKTLKSLMAGQLGGLKQQYEDSTGRKNFLDRLNPAARRELTGGEGGAPSNLPAGAKLGKDPSGAEHYYVPDPSRPGKYMVVQ